MWYNKQQKNINRSGRIMKIQQTHHEKKYMPQLLYMSSCWSLGPSNDPSVHLIQSKYIGPLTRKTM